MSGTLRDPAVDVVAVFDRIRAKWSPLGDPSSARSLAERLAMDASTRQGGVSLELCGEIERALGTMPDAASRFRAAVDVEAAFMLVCVAAVEAVARGPLARAFSERIARASRRLALRGLPQALRESGDDEAAERQWEHAVAERYARIEERLRDVVIIDGGGRGPRVTPAFARALADSLDAHVAGSERAVAGDAVVPIVTRTFDAALAERRFRSRLRRLGAAAHTGAGSAQEPPALRWWALRRLRGAVEWLRAVFIASWAYVASITLLFTGPGPIHTPTPVVVVGIAALAALPISNIAAFFVAWRLGVGFSVALVGLILIALGMPTY